MNLEHADVTTIEPRGDSFLVRCEEGSNTALVIAKVCKGADGARDYQDGGYLVSSHELNYFKECMEQGLTESEFCESCSGSVLDCLDSGAARYIDSEGICIECAESDHRDDATAYAEKHCKVTRELEEYDSTQRYAPCPEAYALGDREAYTENSVYASNRHNCTNYDDLIRDLDRDSSRDRVYYDAIRARIDELLGVERAPW